MKDETMKTVRVKIALEIGTEGNWHAYGGNFVTEDWDEAMDGLEPLDGHVKRVWVEADVSVPEEPEVVAGKAVEVEPA